MTENRNPAESHRDDVATLVRLAGHRPHVPAQRLERAREAARATWSNELRSRSRRRFVRVAAALVAAASIAFAIALRVVPLGPVPLLIAVESLSGSAWVREPSGGDRQPLGVGDACAVGSELSTGGSARVAMRLQSGHSVRLDRGTRVRVLEAAVLALDSGAVYVDSGNPSAGGGGLVVRTPLGEVREIGTQFEVRLGEANVIVRLREGAVTVRQAEQFHRVVAGNELELAADGGAATREIAADAQAWEWASEAAPRIDLEGRTAQEFLEWVARERGWSLAFANPSVARSAAETVVAGAISGMTLDQALEAVLPSCRLRHGVVDGVLRIDAISAQDPS